MSTSVDSLFEQSAGIGVTEAVRRGIVTWILAWFTSVAAGLQTLAEFLFLPFEILIDVAWQTASSLLLEPLGIVSAGADITAQEIQVLGIFALPGSVAIALGAIFIVLIFLQFEITSNIIPGMIVDNRLVDLFTTSPEEEAQGED